MIQWRSLTTAALVVGLSQLAAVPLQAAEGSCGHNEMRTWVNNEEICYHLYGPLSEKWDLKNNANLGNLSDCLDTARDAYKRARYVCELRGETPYREDGIHKTWQRYRTAHKNMQKDLQGRR